MYIYFNIFCMMLVRVKPRKMICRVRSYVKRYWNGVLACAPTTKSVRGSRENAAILWRKKKCHTWPMANHEYIVCISRVLDDKPSPGRLCQRGKRVIIRVVHSIGSRMSGHDLLVYTIIQRDLEVSIVWCRMLLRFGLDLNLVELVLRPVWNSLPQAISRVSQTVAW